MMRTKSLAVLLGLFMAPVLLSGCTAQTALSNTLRAGTAIEDYAGEVVERRKELRDERYLAQNQIIRILQGRALLTAAGGEMDTAISLLTELDAYIDSIYPDIPAAIAQIRAVRRALRGDVEPGASEPSEKFGR